MSKKKPSKPAEQVKQEKLTALCGERKRVENALASLDGTRCAPGLRLTLEEIDEDIKATLGKGKPAVKVTPPEPKNVEPPAPEVEVEKEKPAPKPKAKAKKKKATKEK